MKTAQLNSLTIEGRELSNLSKAIVKTLLYFDIFKHPLTAQEIFFYCQNYSSEKNKITSELEYLEQAKYVNKKNNFFYINHDDSVIERRAKGNISAGKHLKTALKFSSIIASFPFVEGISLSGSISKGYMDKETDIDYFIITKPERLWLCRTLLVLFKKIFLFNSHKYFCVNYFIDSHNLEIPDKNIYTATEIVFIFPTFNEKLYTDFIDANKWTNKYYPNHSKILCNEIVRDRKRPIKKCLEKIFSGKLGKMLDGICFKITLRNWKKKFNDFDAEQFDLNLRSRKNVSKHHPKGFQDKILDKHMQKIKEFETTFNLKLN